MQKTSAISSAGSLHPPSSHLTAASNIAPIKKYTRYFSTELYNHRISVTLRESINDAIKLAARGLSAAEIKARLEETAYRSSIYITVDTMEYLLKNGRATKAAAAIATAFNIKPVLTIQGGKPDAFKKVHGMKKSISVMIDAVAKDIKERFSDVPESRLIIGAAGTLDNREDIDLWVSSLRRAFPNITVYYNPLSCSIACHVGVGAIGLGVSVTEE